MISDSAKSAAQRIVKISHFPNAGYLKNNGSVQTDTSGNWYLSDYIQLPIGAEQITFQLYQYSSAVAMIAFYDNSGIRLSYIATGGTDGSLYKATVSIPAGAYAVRATYHTGSGDQYVELIYPYQDAVQYANAEKAFMRIDTLDKPFSLSGADVCVFGDSIAKGYDHTSAVVANPWPNVLGSKLGFHSIANYAVGGQGYSRGSNNVLAQLQSASLSSKTIIFIGAGTNDYHYGIRLSVFDAAVESAFAYVDSNKSAAAKVIVITPINRTAAPDANSTQFASLDDYRKIITQRALLHGYSVIDGSKFGFSDIAGAYQEATMQDGLHPNQTGYNFYATHIAGLIG
jgi:lysophospholipase L1-like esterase